MSTCQEETITEQITDVVQDNEQTLKDHVVKQQTFLCVGPLLILSQGRHESPKGSTKGEDLFKQVLGKTSRE